MSETKGTSRWLTRWMATETGTIQIERIDSDDKGTLVVNGVFSSLNERNVYKATLDVGVTILLEARDSTMSPPMYSCFVSATASSARYSAGVNRAVPGTAIWLSCPTKTSPKVRREGAAVVASYSAHMTTVSELDADCPHFA